MNRKGPKTSSDFKDSLVFQRELAEMLAEELKAVTEEYKNYKTHYDRIFANSVVVPQDDYAALISERDRYKKALEEVMPIVEEAFYDHHTAGVMPGSGYNHRVYRKVSDLFGWRGSAVFEKWKKEALGK